jgi:DNA-binding response OmpR family regulator
MTSLPHVLIVTSAEPARSAKAARLRDRRFIVSEAESIDAAADFVQSVTPDIILTSEILRDGDCSSLLRLFARDLPVSVIAPGGDAEARCRALELGADDVLAWPMDWRELSLRLTKSVSRWRGREDRMLRAGDLRLDPLTRTAFNADMAGVRLTGAEFEALRLLMRNLGRHLPKGQIYRAAVGGAFNADSRAVDLLMSKTRRKLRALEGPGGRSQSLPRIVAARGAGYCLQQGGGPSAPKSGKTGDSGPPAVSKGRGV